MDRSNLPVILIELALVLGGVLGFAWWQLRSVARDRQQAATKRAKSETAAKAEVSDAQGKTGQKPFPDQAQQD